MSGVTAARAAAAVLEAADAGRDVAVAMLIVAGEAVRRCIVHPSGAVEGSLGAASADSRAVSVARFLLGAERHSESGSGGGGEDDGGGGATRAGDDGGRGAARAEGNGDGGDRFSSPLVERLVVNGVEATLYVEVRRAPEQLVIVGAGHIAVPLAHLGVLLDFRVTVLDDREEMATGDRFDDAVRVVRADFASDPFAGIAIGAHSYVALVTRGHRWDFDCLQRLVRRGKRPRYIGMIGSRRRVRAAFHALLESGVPRDVLATIRAPVGLELEAETPAEIAVAIAAEIVAVRRGADIASISSRERVLERFL
jgi:xanthine/CO dehydrogenase XdhC/CoxF family maturation factor